MVKPSNIEDRIKAYVNEKSKMISKFPNISEADTISTLTEPLLEILGWKILDLNEVQRKYFRKYWNRATDVLKISTRYSRSK